MTETLDLDAPASIETAADLAKETRRLRELLPQTIPTEHRLSRLSTPLDRWVARCCDAPPQHPESIDAGAFSPVTLPHSPVAAYVHYRHTIKLDGAAGGTPVLHVTAADYAATVYLDGRELVTHRGYFAPFETVLDGVGEGRHQLDLVVRRARDYVTWTGGVATHNHGDAHGKGLGSVAGDAVTAGCGLLGPAWVEYQPARRIVDVHAMGDPVTNAMRVRAEVVTDSPAELAADAIVTDLHDGSVTRVSTEVALERGAAVLLEIPIEGARPWTPANPCRYRVDVELSEQLGGSVIDAASRITGFRTFARAEDGTLSLNGESVFLRGTASIGCLWEAAWRGDEGLVVDQLLKVKALFGNVLRVHVHVLPDLAYECADRLGILIYQDAPLQWHCFAPVDDLDEELGQVEELVRHVRSHPSVVVLSLTNEMHMQDPFHDADVCYVRRAHARAAAMDHNMVLMQDHGGPDRPRELPCSFHEYPGYFVGSAREQDSVVDEDGDGCRAVISEYGGGALPSWEAITRAAVAHTDTGDRFPLPAGPEDPWTAEQARHHVVGGMLDLAQRNVGRRDSFAGYVTASGHHQARLLTAQTGRIRRQREKCTGAIQHYLQNPAPRFYNPWIDLAIIDAAGQPRAGMNALREAFRPVAVDVVSLPSRASVGTRTGAELWAYNDLTSDVPVQVTWRWSDEAGATLTADRLEHTLPADSSTKLADLDLPTGATSARHELSVELVIDGMHWTSRCEYVDVIENMPPIAAPVSVLGDVTGIRERWSVLLPELRSWRPDDRATTILVPPGDALSETERAALTASARRGSRVVLLERAPTEDLSWICGVAAVVCDGPICDCVTAEFSLLPSGLTTADLTDWATPDGRVVSAPVLAADLRNSPSWASCGERLQYSAVHEFRVGHGSVVVCQALAWSCPDEPSAARLLHYALTAPTRVM